MYGIRRNSVVLPIDDRSPSASEESVAGKPLKAFAAGELVVWNIGRSARVLQHGLVSILGHTMRLCRVLTGTSVDQANRHRRRLRGLVQTSENRTIDLNALG